MGWIRRGHAYSADNISVTAEGRLLTRAAEAVADHHAQGNTISRGAKTGCRAVVLGHM